MCRVPILITWVLVFATMGTGCEGDLADGGAGQPLPTTGTDTIESPSDGSGGDAGPTTCTTLTCSGVGTCVDHGDGVHVCACEPGYTGQLPDGQDCVPTTDYCKGGAISFDVDGDGTLDDWFEPTEDECFMYELINLTRATHDAEGTPECHTPLAYDVEWSAHGRHHSKAMSDQGELFHDDWPSAQNCAYGCGPDCEMSMYMTGEGEDHCPPLSHHCNIMRCSTSAVGVGYFGTWNTQNFL